MGRVGKKAYTWPSCATARRLLQRALAARGLRRPCERQQEGSSGQTRARAEPWRARASRWEARWGHWGARDIGRKGRVSSKTARPQSARDSSPLCRRGPREMASCLCASRRQAVEGRRERSQPRRAEGSGIRSENKDSHDGLRERGERGAGKNPFPWKHRRRAACSRIGLHACRRASARACASGEEA